MTLPDAKPPSAVDMHRRIMIQEQSNTAWAAANRPALEGRRVLIAGATGLLGLHLAALLWEAGAEVVGLARHKPEPWARPLFAEFHASPLTCCGGKKLGRFDLIVHAAGHADPSRFTADPAGTLACNTTGLEMLISRMAPRGRFLYLSSAEVYSGLVGNWHEGAIGTTMPDHPRGVYIEAKRAGEALCHAHRRAGRDVRIARVALAYGPGVKADDGRVLSELIRQAVAERQVRPRGSLAVTRTYIYAADAAAMLLDILLSGHAPVYNVAGNSPRTLQWIAELIAGMEDVPLHQVKPYGDAAPGSPSFVMPDITRYCTEFGTPAFTPLDAGLERAIAWQRLLHEDQAQPAAS